MLLLGAIGALLWLWSDGRLTMADFAVGVSLAALAGGGGFLYPGARWSWILLGLLVGLIALKAYQTPDRDWRALRSDLGRLRRRVSEESSDPAAWAATGETLQRLRRYGEALQYYQQAERLEPRNLDYQQKVKQMQHIIEARDAQVRACPACNSPVHGWTIACPKCGEVVNEYLYLAHRFGRDQYLFVAGTATGTLLLVLALGAPLGWRPPWLVAMLIVSSVAFALIGMLCRSRKIGGGG